MRPEEYFPNHYRTDVRVFAEVDLPAHGPFGLLCGRTLGRLFEPGQPEKYADPEGFLCMLWLLNLAHQGIYTYFPGVYQRWLNYCEPFPDLRGCHSFHGGILAPGDLLRFAQDPSYIPGARPLELDRNRVGTYFQYFFSEYLGELARHDRADIGGFLPSELLGRLRNDPSSSEVARYV